MLCKYFAAISVASSVSKTYMYKTSKKTYNLKFSVALRFTLKSSMLWFAYRFQKQIFQKTHGTNIEDFKVNRGARRYWKFKTVVFFDVLYMGTTTQKWLFDVLIYIYNINTLSIWLYDIYIYVYVYINIYKSSFLLCSNLYSMLIICNRVICKLVI